MSLYQCDRDYCTWRNPGFRYSLADAGAEWASHAEAHRRKDEQVPVPAPIFGLCTNCGALEVALNEATGTRDFSSIGEAANYPTGYGCEVCS